MRQLSPVKCNVMQPIGCAISRRRRRVAVPARAVGRTTVGGDAATGLQHPDPRSGRNRVRGSAEGAAARAITRPSPTRSVPPSRRRSSPGPVDPERSGVRKPSSHGRRRRRFGASRRASGAEPPALGSARIVTARSRRRLRCGAVVSPQRLRRRGASRRRRRRDRGTSWSRTASAQVVGVGETAAAVGEIDGRSQRRRCFDLRRDGAGRRTLRRTDVGRRRCDRRRSPPSGRRGRRRLRKPVRRSRRPPHRRGVAGVR